MFRPCVSLLVQVERDRAIPCSIWATALSVAVNGCTSGPGMLFAPMSGAWACSWAARRPCVSHVQLSGLKTQHMSYRDGEDWLLDGLSAMRLLHAVLSSS